MKKSKVILMSLLALFAFTIATSNNVSASTYHKGTPKVVRGNYRNVEVYKNNKLITKMYIRKNKLEIGVGMQFSWGSKIHYKKVGKHSYILKGIFNQTQRPVYYKIIKVSNKKIKVKSTYDKVKNPNGNVKFKTVWNKKYYTYNK